MIRTDYDTIRQGINTDTIRVEGIVNHEGNQYYILTDLANQSTDHALVGGQAMLDAYMDFFSLV